MPASISSSCGGRVPGSTRRTANATSTSAAAIAVTSLGHAHPRLVEAITQQAGELWHTSNLYRIPNQERLARRLVDATFASSVFFAQFGRRSHRVCAQDGTGDASTPGVIRNDTAPSRSAGALSRAHADNHCRGRRRQASGGIRSSCRRVRPGSAPRFERPARGHRAPRRQPSCSNRSRVRAASPPVDPTRSSKWSRSAADEFGLLVIYDEVQCGMGRTGPAIRP